MRLEQMRLKVQIVDKEPYRAAITLGDKEILEPLVVIKKNHGQGKVYAIHMDTTRLVRLLDKETGLARDGLPHGKAMLTLRSKDPDFWAEQIQIRLVDRLKTIHKLVRVRALSAMEQLKGLELLLYGEVQDGQ